ncbi:MAG TPA: hypothetical protein PLB49_12515, partial [Chitinophagaceae bacterium]|nr:hypothetical protein [Chitinophagaceae bacterium]
DEVEPEHEGHDCPGSQTNRAGVIKQTAQGATHSIKPLYYTGTIGLAAGATYTLPGRFPGLRAGFRINRELTKINKINVGGGTLHSTVFALSLGYTFKK